MLGGRSGEGWKHLVHASWLRDHQARAWVGSPGDTRPGGGHQVQAWVWPPYALVMAIRWTLNLVLLCYGDK